MIIRIDPQQQQRTLKKHGKTFYFAGLFLGKVEFERATALYSFLRNVDDMVDEANSKASATHRLNRIRCAIQQDTKSTEQLTSRSFRVSEDAVTEFLRGMAFDTGEVEIRDKSELEDYCYCVAGTVGEMMCNALGCNDSRALDHAIDLGIAMQMTNIARDVYEDAERSRRYLPASWVGELSPEQVLQAENSAESAIKDGVCRLIENARIRYRHARLGIALLPFRSRFAILAASYLYQEIGEQILMERASQWKRRKQIGLAKKVMITVKCIARFVTSPSYWRYKKHRGIGRPTKRSKILITR